MRQVWNPSLQIASSPLVNLHIISTNNAVVNHRGLLKITAVQVRPLDLNGRSGALNVLFELGLADIDFLVFQKWRRQGDRSTAARPTRSTCLPTCRMAIDLDGWVAKITSLYCTTVGSTSMDAQAAYQLIKALLRVRGERNP